MNNCIEYIKWRGDLTFEASPFNEVDNYIISKIGTMDFSGIVDDSAEEVLLSEAVRVYRERYGEEGSYLGALASKSIVPAVEMLPNTERFKDLKLSGFVKSLKPDDFEQFSALTITLPDGRHYISFRGTDDTLLAWKENLLMSVEETVAAQEDALTYLINRAGLIEGELIVGGHSKGGNLAEYAAAQAPMDIQNRISGVYSFDGPGFKPEFFDSEGYKGIEPKLNLILPQCSIVGTLLLQNKEFTIVKALKGGVAAHDGFTWEVLGKEFVRCENFTKWSSSFNDVMDTLIETTDIEERRTIICEVFDILAQTGANTITDMTEHSLRQGRVIIKSLRKSPETKKFLLAMLELFAQDMGIPIKTSKKKS